VFRRAHRASFTTSIYNFCVKLEIVAALEYPDC